MRIQTFIYQYGYILIHHFIKIIRVMSTVLLLRYRTVLSSVWENSDTLGYSHLIGGVSKRIRCRGEFPTFLQYLSDLALLHLYLRVYQQKKKVVVTERECVRADTIHNVKDKFLHLYL